MEKWLSHQFSSGSRTGEDFKRFARNFRANIKKQLGDQATIKKFSVNHYELSGFIEKDGKFVYFSISDVRYFTNNWYNKILIRTAEHEKDFRGGINQYTSLDNFKSSVLRLLV